MVSSVEHILLPVLILFAVDICITTNGKDLENVCMVAELLARSELMNLLRINPQY